MPLKEGHKIEDFKYSQGRLNLMEYPYADMGKKMEVKPGDFNILTNKS